MNKTMLFAMLALTMSMAAPGNAEIPNMARDMIGGGMKGKKLAKAIAEAEKHPLGSRENPVRENMPQGQRAYLSRSCAARSTAPPASPVPAMSVRGHMDRLSIFTWSPARISRPSRSIWTCTMMAVKRARFPASLLPVADPDPV